MKCPKCSYNWETKAENPKKCPRCQARLDWGKWNVQ